MNPINDEIPTKENNQTDVEKPKGETDSTEKTDKPCENSEKTVTTIEVDGDDDENNAKTQNENDENLNEIQTTNEIHETENISHVQKEELSKEKSNEIRETENISDDQIEQTKENRKTEHITDNPKEQVNKNLKMSENITKQNETEKSIIKHSDCKDSKEADDEQKKDKLVDSGKDKTAEKDKNSSTPEDTNENTSVVSETVEEEDVEEFEDVEDVEIPGEEDVDEIIVPDEAEAEDLTDDKDDHIDKSQNEDEEMEDDEEGTIKDSEDNENDASLHEEENTKSSAAIEEDTDKKSVSNYVQEDTCSKDYEDGDIENIPIEPELIAIEESIKDSDSTLESSKSNDNHLDEDSTSQANYDPLNCTDNQDEDDDDTENVKIIENDNSVDNKSFENNDTVNTNEEDDDDDDEVQFVETRNSPICIESDDEDDTTSKDTAESKNTKNENSKQTITTATTSVNVPKNIIVTRTSARKSTAKAPQRQPQHIANESPSTVPQVQNKPKNFNYLQKATTYKRPHVAPSAQHIVDCIELLDSSDEEASNSRTRRPQQQQSRTPQKRTLLAAKGNYYKSNNKNPSAGNNRLPNNFSPHVRQQIKKPEPPPLPPPTPQSNFLNAVQLQPASISGSNPPAFSALLSNKNVIIPNAFYGNPPNVRSLTDADLERRYVRWLENFLNQFCNSQFVATHSCFVFLQRALKYKDFVRVKALRTNMNSHAQTAPSEINTHLLSDLKAIFLKNKKITAHGRRFCELTCSSVTGKAVALMAHGINGKVTLKTCNMDIPKTGNTAVSSSSSSVGSANTLTRKRHLEEDEDEYTPDKSKVKSKTKNSLENGDEDSGETGDGRKRSLRTKRTKRIDNSFSYNEDDLLAEYEIDDEDDAKLAQVEIQRKIEQKRLEAQMQRQQQAKSFESAFIQAFAKSIDGPTTSTTTNSTNQQRLRLKNSTTTTGANIRQYSANNDAEDLLQATWIENDDTQVISDDDEPKEHRIYKQQQQLQQDYYSPTNKLPTRINTNPSPKVSARITKRSQEEIITGDDDYDENSCFSNSPSNVDPLYWPKNVDPHMYVNGKNKDKCIICNLSCQRLVHHYVNEHRGCEVYNSRLSPSQIKQLKNGNCTVSNVSLYKNGQFQYEAYCIFCQKQSRFMLPYWYQHFTMHTGEYAYRCTGCGIRKPTRSLLTQHQAQGCPQEGGIIQDYAHDSKSMQIEARICTLCNYVQMHRTNIVKHLHLQHNIKQILPKHIQTIVLMKTPATLSSTPSSSPIPSPSSSAAIKRVNYKPISQSRSTSSSSTTYVIDDDDMCEEIFPEEQQPTQTENNYYNYIPPYMQAAVNSGNFSFEDVDAGDDLSFMICGMLDVQMNTDVN